MGCSVPRQVIFWSLVGDFAVLTWLGRCPAEEPFNLVAQVAAGLYFLFFILFFCWNYIRGLG